MKTQEEIKKSIQIWKNIALSVNDKWNQNSTWKLAESEFGKLDAKDNNFIESLLNQMFGIPVNGKATKSWLSEKQAYFLAKFAVETNQLS